MVAVSDWMLETGRLWEDSAALLFKVEDWVGTNLVKVLRGVTAMDEVVCGVAGVDGTAGIFDVLTADDDKLHRFVTIRKKEHISFKSAHLFAGESCFRGVMGSEPNFTLFELQNASEMIIT